MLGTLSKDIFERRTSTGSQPFSLFICLDANKLVLLSFFSLLKTIYPRVSTKPLPNDAKSSLPVDVRRSKTLLLKLPIIFFPLVSHFALCAKLPHLPSLAHKGPVMQAMGVRQVLNTRDPKPYVLFISRFAYWLQIFGKHTSFFMVNIEVTIIRNFNRGFN